jgi:uncharacterized protein (DUF2336 family)
LSNFSALIDDLESAVHAGSQERRVKILRNVTDLFLGNAGGYSGQQIDVFDDVLAHLIKEVESNALAELGARLAPVENAPKAVIRNLARHDEIAVAGPVLAQSAMLSDNDLIEIAKTKGQEHLGAISERKRIAAVVTDILVERGDINVARKLSGNQGASFSDIGFSLLANRARSDEHLAQNLGMRLDMPPRVLKELVENATEAVKARLLAAAPQNEAMIQSLLASVSSKVLKEAGAPRDFTRAEAAITKMHASNSLNEAAVVEFAKSGQYEMMVAGLARLCQAPVDLIEPLMQNVSYDGLLVAFKACGLHWPTFSAVLTSRFGSHQVSPAAVEKARQDFLKISAATSQRVFRFWLVRGLAKGPTTDVRGEVRA